MSIHEKLAARLREKYNHTRACAEAKQPRRRTDPECFACEMHVLADEVELGRHDGVLGVREPTIEDVQREAVKKYGPKFHHAHRNFGAVEITVDAGLDSAIGPIYVSAFTTPTIKSAYAALRALPDYEVGK